MISSETRSAAPEPSDHPRQQPPTTDSLAEAERLRRKIAALRALGMMP